MCALGFARSLNAHAKKARKKIDVHVNVDTGMGRLGVWNGEARDFIKKLIAFSHIRVKGIYTHFPVADTSTKFTEKQVTILYRLISDLDKEIENPI